MTAPSDRRITRLLAAAFLAACLAASWSSAASDRPQSTADRAPAAAAPTIGGFAFSDRAGGRLMLLGAIAHMFDGLSAFEAMEQAAPTLRTAFCSGGRALPITFDRRQPADGKGNGRQSHFQFEHLEGLVFSLQAGERLPETATCFLAPEVFRRDLQLVPLVEALEVMPGPASRACDGELATKLASHRSRAVEHCWQLARPRSPGGLSVVLVEFVRQGNSALASLVVIDGATMVFADQKGDYAQDGGLSVWRVEDEGKLDPRWFDVLLLARRGPKVLLAFAWQGAEGRVMRLLESDGDRFRELLGESWYQAPV